MCAGVFVVVVKKNRKIESSTIDSVLTIGIWIYSFLKMKRGKGRERRKWRWGKRGEFQHLSCDPASTAITAKYTGFLMLRPHHCSHDHLSCGVFIYTRAETMFYKSL